MGVNKVKYLIVISFFIIIFMSVSITAMAHKPVDVSGPASREMPIMIEDHQISWAAYTELSRVNEVDYYKFTAEKGEEIYSNLLIPYLERFKDFHPTIALIGPGLPLDYSVENVNLAIKEGEGAIIKRYESNELEEFYEPFTQTRYYVKQSLIVNAPQTSEYFLAVFNEKEETGKYVFAIGRKEVWKPGEIVKLPKTWWDVRMFMEQEKSTYAITIGVGIVGLYLLSTLFR
mgnify:CR=1 FL=1